MNILDITPKTTPFIDKLPRAFSWSMPRKKPAATSRQQPMIFLDTLLFNIRIENMTTNMIVVDRAT